jgi:UDP-GlcNAc:undecaprenyl-phosphate GlcNAc-1-phosphate transferase
VILHVCRLRGSVPILISVAVVAWLLAAALTPLARRLALRIGATDAPNGRKLHTDAVPRLGGLAVVVSVAMALMATPAATRLLTGAAVDLGDARVWVALAAGGAMVFGVGLWDDVRGLPALVKLLVEIAAAGAVVSQDIVMYRLTVLGTTIELGWLAVPLTIIWLVGITNAFNLIDGLDGLAAGLAIIASATGATLFVVRGNAPGALPLAATIGAAAGFLPYHFFPASVFLGDAGSLSLGFVLAVTSITGWQKGATAIAIGGPLLVLALPILDTAISVARRLPNRGRLFVADRRHLHHRLVSSGLSPRVAVLFLYGVALIGSVLALATSRP